jgi:hypothetical protein
MQYLLMCCFDEDRWQGIPEQDRDGIMRDYGAWLRDIDGSHQHLASARLRPTSTATTIRVKDGRTMITDGPFAETKEQFGGYHLVECKDLDEAISIAMRIPTLPFGGTVEVRPVEPAP